ncbi:ketosteroid isomerase-like protein [Streptomyces griseochromogenes]|uniref:Ketosteroid isomerase-like protein n=1 Tax=Streptomyces griseochromogenes TaxID=68214 RepID=A0A1B1BE36_9ACTN|nr:nuclear transport factor 2 family protein [Streptomyces griseochromogenes]ANP57084.1 SnoaL-like polyketide cyclase [Streptomyces griseochromogenes]MBP2050633.1 ketosteroid isomerase-like protein [Streptomyces griseochromogenes]
MAEHPHATLVRKSYDAFFHADLDALRELMTADATQHVPGSHPVSGDFKGQDAVIGMYRRLFQETGGSLRADLRDVFVDGRGHAVALHHITAEREGRRYHEDGCLVFRIVGDKITDIDQCVPDIDLDNAFWG